MKRFILLIAALGAFLNAAAQGTENDLLTDLRTRTSVELDWKLAKGLHLEAGYELRTDNALTALDRHQASIGLSYKIAPWLKAGVGYDFIYHHRNSGAWTPRHRFNGDLTFSWKTGPWRLSLKEQVRFMHKTESLNSYQEVADPIMLKSRAKVQYKGLGRVEPYIFAEVRTIFNDPSFTATWSTTSKAYADYQFTGYNSTYFNRYRGALGAEWEITKNHALDFCVMVDYCRDKNLDVNKAGTYLKSFTWDRNLNTILSVGYKFSF